MPYHRNYTPHPTPRRQPAIESSHAIPSGAAMVPPGRPHPSGRLCQLARSRLAGVAALALAAASFRRLPRPSSRPCRPVNNRLAGAVALPGVALAVSALAVTAASFTLRSRPRACPCRPVKGWLARAAACSGAALAFTTLVIAALAIAPLSSHAAQAGQTAAPPKVLGIHMESDNPSDRYAKVGNRVTVTVFTDSADTVAIATAAEPSTAAEPRLAVAIGGVPMELAKISPADGSASRTNVFAFTVTRTTPEGPMTASYRGFDQLSALTRVTVDRTAPTITLSTATSNADGRSVTPGDTVTITAEASEEVSARVFLGDSPVPLARSLSPVGTILRDNSGASLGSPETIFVHGDYAYVTTLGNHSSHSLEILDISNPATPTHVRSVFHDDPNSDTDGNSGAALFAPRSVFVRGNYAYVVASTSNSLQILDVSDPVNPSPAGVIFHDNPADDTDGNSGAMLAGPRSVVVRGSYAYVTAFDSQALQIVDVSDPANPRPVGVLRHDNPDDNTDGNSGAMLAGARSVVVRGRYAYVCAWSSSSLQIVDVSDPENPTHVGSIRHDDPDDDEDGNSGAKLFRSSSVFVVGDYAYVTARDENALQILDVSDPANPIPSGIIFHDDPEDDTDGNSGAALWRPLSVFVRGGYAYVAVAVSDALQVVDVSDPANPRPAGAIFHDNPDDDTDGNSGAVLESPSRVFVSGNHVYVTLWGAAGLTILELGNTRQATVTATAAQAADDLDDLPLHHAFVDPAGHAVATEIFRPAVARPLAQTAFTARQGEPFRYALPAGTFSYLDRPDTMNYLFTSSPDASSWLAVDPLTGVFSGTPDNGDVTLEPIVVTAVAADADGDAAAVAFRLSVADVNDTPLAVDDTLNVLPGGAAVPLNLLANDSDVDAGQSLAVTGYSAGGALGAVVTAPGTALTGAFGTLTIAADGTATYAPGEDEGEDVFTYRIGDGSRAANASATATLTVTVEDFLAATRPVVAGTVATQVTAVGLDFRLDLSGLALSDPDGPDDQVAAVLAPVAGGSLPRWLEFDPETRVLAGRPVEAGDVAELELAVTPIDGEGTPGYPLTFMLLVREIALAVSGRFVSLEDRLHVRVRQMPGGGTPAAAVRYELAVSSPTVGIVTGGATGHAHTVTVDIPPGSAPGTVHETVFAFDRAASPGADPGPNEVSVALRHPAAAAEAFAIAGDALLTQQVPTRPPSGIPTAADVLENLTLTVTEPWTLVVPETAFGEPDGEPLAYAAALADGRPLPDWLRFSAATRTFNGIPPSVAVSLSYLIAVTARDPHGYGAADSFALDFRAVAGNSPPAFATPVPGRHEPVQDTDFLLDVAGAFADGDGDSLTFHAAAAMVAGTPARSVPALLERGEAHALPAWLAFDGATGVFRGTPDQMVVDAGPFVVAVTANDGRGGEASLSFVIAPVNINDAPLPTGAILNRQVAVSEPVTLDISGAFADADGDPLEYGYSASPTAPWLSLDARTGAFSGTPPAAVDGEAFEVLLTADDGNGGQAQAGFVLQVGEPNAEPVAAGLPNRRVRAGLAFALAMPAGAFADANGDALAYAHTARPETPWLSLDARTGMLTGTPPPATLGATFEVTVTAADGRGGQARATFDLVVGELNSAPVAVGLPDRHVRAGSPFVLALPAVAFVDADGDRLTYAHTVAPAAPWLSLDAATGALSGTPPEVIAGQDFEVSVTADDGFGGQARTVFALRLGESNLAPAVAYRMPNLTAYAGIPFSHPVPRNAFGDGDADRLSFDAGLADGGALPGWLSFDRVAGTFAGVPTADDVSDAGVIIALTAADGHGGSADLEFSLMVAEAPTRASLAVDEDEWVLELPYVDVNLPPPLAALSCLALRLTAPADNVSRWSAAVTDTAPLNCGVPGGNAALPTLREPFRLGVPAAEYVVNGQTLCMAMEFVLGDGFELAGIAISDCP